MLNPRAAFVCFTGNSGLTDYSVSLLRELMRLRNVFFLTADSFDEGKYGSEIPVLKVFRRTRHYPLDIFRLAWTVLNRRPRLVVFQSWLKVAFLDALIVRLFRLFGICCVITVHDLLPHYPRRWSKLEMRFFYRSFDGAVVHSKRQAEGMRALGLDMPLLVVPHGVYDLFNTRGLTQAEARRELPELSADRFTALFFGFLDHRKGIAEFIDAAVRLRESEDFQFVVAGKAEQRPVVLDALERARTAGNVLVHDFMIPHEDVQRYFAACDVVVLPYLEGTTSGVLKLAMAFGKPIICTDIGDFPETLESWPGLMVDSERLVDDLVAKLLMARDRGAELFEQGARHADDFRWDRIAQRYDEFVRSLEHEA
ncbi:glycosyltransferase [Methyloversatilis thermotolerans]|uniref:glycosyltransferase n=1 Tax=Methyloversatilis thermotolerans TaxID=1346290 RepID=UPI00098223BE